MDTSSEAIVIKVEQSYHQILRLYQSMPVAELLTPAFVNGWSVKDVLGHIAAWEWRCVGLLNQSHDTNMPLQAAPDVDALNEEIYQERKGWSWDDVAIDAHKAHQALLATIYTLPQARLADPILQKAIAEETWEHYEEHLSALEYWHKQVTGSNR